MSRDVSETGQIAINSQETDEVFVYLLTISYPGMSDPIRVSSNSVGTISNGNTFIHYPFSIALPNDSDSAPVMKLKIDNVDQQIVSIIRTIVSTAFIDIQVVLASDPDVIEMEWLDFVLRKVSYSSLTVEGDLVLENFMSEPFPVHDFTPNFFPGVFS